MRAGRTANLARIRALDPERDHLAIYQTMLRYEFPWDLKMGLNLAFIRGFAVPSVAALHVATGELTEHTQQRLDETGTLMYEMMLNGLDEPRGREALRRINQIHRHYEIANEEYLYALGCLVMVPLRWLERYGWRRPCCHERRAAFAFYRALGTRMGIKDIPPSPAALAAWFDAHDEALLRPNADAAKIERATRSRMVARLRIPLFGDALVRAMYDERLRRAAGVTRPPWAVRAALHVGLKTRARLLRWFGRPRAVPLFADGIRTATHPDGYDIAKLGPDPAPPRDAHPAT